MAHLRLSDVHVEYQLLSVRDYNLKRQLLEAARRHVQPPRVINALSGINLDVPEGTRLGLIGANGAGKSTLLSVLAGLLPATSGRVEAHGRVLALLGGAAAGLDPEATGRDNVITMGVQLGESPAAMRERIEDVTEFSGLSTRIDHPVHTYSSGMQARLRFSILTSLRPDVLLVDEGISMADAEFAHRASQRLAEFITSAGILVLASHTEALVQQQCDSAVWLHQGAIMSSGDVAHVLADYRASHTSAAADAPLPDAVHERIAAIPGAAAKRPENERVVARSYWKMLGRAPDLDGLAVHSDLLADGMTKDELDDLLYNCAEATQPREAWSGTLYLGLSHDIPFSRRTNRRAQHLVVTFPGAGTHRFIPQFADAAVSGRPVHELAVGMANRRPSTAPELQTWAWDVAELIRETADDLDVTYNNVICVGHSFHAYGALLAGLIAQAGHLALGAPPILYGTMIDQLFQWMQKYPSTHVLFEWHRTRGGIAADPLQIAELDALTSDTARSSRHAAEITLLVSEGDIFFDTCRAFAADAGSSGRLHCEVAVADYPNHDAMGPQYLSFARKYIDAVVDSGAPALEGRPRRGSPPLVPIPGLDPDPNREPPDYERMVSRAYWQVLGRAPDPDGSALAIGRLKKGSSIGQLLADIRASDEAREQREEWTGEVYLGKSHDVPYSLDRREGARHLVVTFPGVGTHRYVPKLFDDAITPGLPTHRLAIGVGMARPFQHAGMMSYGNDVATLIQRVVDNLGVALDDTICLGHSVQGMAALHVGLLAQVGHVLAGAPPLGGTEIADRALQASRESRASGNAANLVEYLNAAADVDDLPGSELIDPMFADTAINARHHSTIEIFVSRKDLFWVSCDYLTKLLADHPTLTCRLVESKYAGHRRMAAPYDDFLFDRISAIVGRIPEPADV